MKYNQNFERDYNWYLENKDIFNFDGTLEYTDKHGNSIFIEDNINGLTAKECFYLYDSNGKVSSCKELELYKQIHKCKGSINFNIKMWAEDRGKGNLGKMEFDRISKELNLLDWMINAVEKQKFKHYEYKNS